MQNLKLSKNVIIGILLLIILAGGIPLTLSQSQVQQILTGRAWSTSQTASAECAPSGTVIINVSFTNQESSRSMIVTAVDNQSNKSTNLGKIEPKKSKTGEIDTQKTSLNNGNVIFKLAWADNPDSTDSRVANYSSVGQCAEPTPSPTPTNYSCPTGTQKVGEFSGGPLLANKEPSNKSHTFNLPSLSKITVIGTIKEGHPEDCPNGPTCKQGQKFEEITVSINGTKIGESTDQGGDVDAWVPAGPWETSSEIASGTVNVLIAHRKRSTAGPESVDYKLFACAGEPPTPTPSPTPTICPTPGTVKNIQIQCPYCTPSPDPNQ